MRDAIFHLKRNKSISLQAQIRETLVDAILGGQLGGGEPLPSSRRMADNLGVSRNTVVLAYQNLVDDGYLLARERSGYYVNDELSGQISHAGTPRLAPSLSEPDWEA
ncbi:MAG: winged helix-turn-helix domain-containing protein, partial [Rhodospirillales bacterium]|nr:winged helix-turn-helix domain-containing protein [Rhodospirillales bacterium]